MNKHINFNKKFKSFNVFEKALEGMEHVSPFVEHMRDSGARELLTRGSLGNLVVGKKMTASKNPISTDSGVGDGTGSSNITLKNLPILTRRNSYNIVEVLPVAYFCPVARDENFQSIFNFTQSMPAGVTCVVTNVDNKYQRFTYTKGLLVDTIDVYTDFAVSYLTIQNMLENDAFQAKFVKLTVGTGNYDLQFNSASLQWGRLTFGGMVDTDSNPPAMYKRTEQQQNNIINADITFRFNGRRYLVWGMASSIVNPGDALVRMDYFLEGYESSVDFGLQTGCNN